MRKEPMRPFDICKRLATALTTAVLVTMALPQTVMAQEDEEEGALVRDDGPERPTLADRIPAVSGRFFPKAGRVQVSPLVGMVLNDPFHTTVPVGLGIHIHLMESLAIGASGLYYLSLQNTAPVPGGGGAPPPANYNQAAYDVRGEIRWAPIYGKLSIMAEDVIHFDTYITAFGGMMGPEVLDSSLSFGAAVGQHYFLTQSMALRLEVSGQLVSIAPVPDKDPNLQQRFVVGATLGFSFFFGGGDDAPSGSN